MSVKHYLLALVFIVPGAASASITLGFHSEEPAPQLAKLLSSNNPTGEDIQLRPFADASLLNQALVDGEVDLAIFEEPTVAGQNVTMLSELYPVVLHLLYRGENTPGSISELLSLGAYLGGSTRRSGLPTSARVSQ